MDGQIARWRVGSKSTGDEARRKACEGGEHLVGADHGKAVPERDDDRGLDTGQLPGQHDMLGHFGDASGHCVVPVDSPEVRRRGRILVDPGQLLTQRARGGGGIR